MSSSPPPESSRVIMTVCGTFWADEWKRMRTSSTNDSDFKSTCHHPCSSTDGSATGLSAPFLLGLPFSSSSSTPSAPAAAAAAAEAAVPLAGLTMPSLSREAFTVFRKAVTGFWLAMFQISANLRADCAWRSFFSSVLGKIKMGSRSSR